jgi:hypothetical protein
MTAQATKKVCAPRHPMMVRMIRVQPGADSWRQLPLLIHRRGTAHSIKWRGQQPRGSKTQEKVRGELVAGEAQQVPRDLTSKADRDSTSQPGNTSSSSEEGKEDDEDDSSGDKEGSRSKTSNDGEDDLSATGSR